MKSRRGDTATRGRGDKSSRLRVSASSADNVPRSTSRPVSTSPRRRIPASPRPSAPSPRHPVATPLITLLTDFGSADYFVGALKGVILSVNPQARIVDITHEIPPRDITATAFTLLVAYGSFPVGTIHLAVVDPGVGSARRPILVVTGDQFFVGPDNGIFSYIIDRERSTRVFQISNENYFRHPVSATFHGRDIFAPVAAALSNGVAPEELGVEIQDCVRLPALAPDNLGKGKLRARIIHIDRFGNCITNLTQSELTPAMIDGGAQLSINSRIIKSFRRFFSDEDDDDEKLFAVWGSAGFLEIAAQNRSAAKLLKARRGQAVLVSTPK